MKKNKVVVKIATLKLPEEISGCTEFMVNDGGGRITVRDYNNKEYCFYIPKWFVWLVDEKVSNGKKSATFDIQDKIKKALNIKEQDSTIPLDFCHCIHLNQTRESK